MRKLKKIDVNFISLVDRGPNRKKLIFKNNTGNASAFEKDIPIKKFDEEQKLVFCIVYSPDETDAQGDSASADVIKEAAYNFMKCARTNNVDKQHDFIPDEGFVAESWIVKENDNVFPGEPEGSWAVGIKVENEETWQAVKNNELTGISLAGLAIIEEAEKQQNELTMKSINEWFEAPKENAGTEKDSLTENAINALADKLAVLEKMNRELICRLEKIENGTPCSSQIKKENRTPQDKIKIWT